MTSQKIKGRFRGGQACVAHSLESCIQSEINEAVALEDGLMLDS